MSSQLCKACYSSTPPELTHLDEASGRMAMLGKPV